MAKSAQMTHLERFRTQNDTCFATPDTGYSACTLGMNWKQAKWLIIHPEARYDWADGPIKVFDNHQASSQWLLGLDLVIMF